MKWSALATLFAAPLALAGAAIQADLVVRTNGKSSNGDMEATYNGYSGGTTVIVEEVVLIWVCMGGGSTTTTMASVTGAKSAIATHTVIVGGSAGLVYTPESVNAAVGDMVVFTFMSTNHTATQSSFGTPCEALSGGKDSGFMPNVNNTVNPPPQMAIQVSVSTPLWFYCRQKGHCGKGMVFSINPTANKTQEMFKQMAIAQNGTGTTAGIAATSAAMAVNSMANTMTTVAAATATSMMSAAMSTQTAVSSSSGMTYGSGFTGSGEACSCSCFCGVAQFPSSVQGLEGFGGMSGAMPRKS